MTVRIQNELTCKVRVIDSRFGETIEYEKEFFGACGGTIFITSSDSNYCDQTHGSCWDIQQSSSAKTKPVVKQKKLNVKAKFDPKYRSFWTKQHKEG